MGALKMAAVPADVRWLSMATLAVLPDLYQTRDNTDPRFVKKYHEDMIEYGGYGGFPPVLVYELPDGTLALVGGFTRFAAYEKFLRNWNRSGREKIEWTIQARVLEGTPSDALLASVADNTHDLHVGRKYTAGDSQCSAGKLVRLDATRVLSDKAIARQCRMSPHAVRKVRVRLLETEGVPLPERVHRIKDGNIWGGMTPYRHQCGGRPRMTQCWSNGGRTVYYVTRINNRRYYLGLDRDEAARKLERIGSSLRYDPAILKNPESLRSWLLDKGVNCEPAEDRTLRGWRIKGRHAFVLSLATRAEILEKLALACLARGESGASDPLLIWSGSSFEPNAGVVASLARNRLPWLRWVTPEEVVAEFGPEGFLPPTPPEDVVLSRTRVRARSFRLTDDQVREIRRRVAAGESQSALASEFGVSQSCISRAKRRHGDGGATLGLPGPPEAGAGD